MNKKLKELLEALRNAKKVEAAGFSTDAQVKDYLSEKETLLDSAAKAIEEMSAISEAEFGALKAQMEELKKSLAKPTEIKELSKTEMLANIGKMVSAQFRKNFDVMAELGATPQVRTGIDQDWTEGRNLMFDKNIKKFVNKDPSGSPFGGTTDGQYVINTIYERELMRYAGMESAMMGKVRTIPMAGNTISWPVLNRFTGTLSWHTNPQGMPAYAEAGKPSFGARVEITCQTLAGWIPWYDMFQDDIQANVEIGSLFLEMFAELYGQEFDRQVLYADADPFTGLFKAAGQVEYVISGATPMATVLDDLVNAPLRIRIQDRKKGVYIVSEDFVTWLAANRNAMGDYVWQSPIEGVRPGMIAGKPYIEVPSMKSIHEVGAGEAFAWFGDPQNMLHGNRMAIELRTYRETEANMLYGEEFIRFRKRDGFKFIRPDQSVLIKTAARG